MTLSKRLAKSSLAMMFPVRCSLAFAATRVRFKIDLFGPCVVLCERGERADDFLVPAADSPLGGALVEDAGELGIVTAGGQQNDLLVGRERGDLLGDVGEVGGVEIVRVVIVVFYVSEAIG